MTDLDIYEEIVRLSHLGEPYALATVVAQNGSSPRKLGAKMLVRGDGSTMGTVGGGLVEHETIEAAVNAISAGDPWVLEFVLNEEYGFVCGGSMTVFVEPQKKRALLVIFGAGHIGRAVSLLANKCGFRVVVVDERPDCAVHDLLPGAHEVHCCQIREAFSRFIPDRDSFVIIATPGYKSDFDAVRECLASDAGFIGLLGSSRKKAVLMQTLTDEGYNETQRDRIITPVGHDISAETPEEIAVSIVAQLIKQRRQR